MFSGVTSIRPKELDLGKTTLQHLAKVFQNTTHLQLQIAPMKTDQETKKYRDHMQAFAGLFPKLSEISLAFGTSPHTGFNPHAAPLYRRFMSKLNTSNLTDLNLRETATEGAALCKLITRSPKLKELKLDGLDLTTGDWPPVLKAISKLEYLDHLHLMYLREAGNKAYFLKQLDEDVDDLTPGNAFSHMMNPGWDDDDYDDEDDDTDDDLPDLEPASGHDPHVAPPHGPTLPSLGSAVNFGSAPTTTTTNHTTAAAAAPPSTTTTAQFATADPAEAIPGNEPISDYVPNGTAADYGERGFYICISGHAKIMRELPIFIKEYSLGEALEDEEPPGIFGGIAGLAGFGAIPLGAGAPGAGPLGGPGAALADLLGGMGAPTNNPLSTLFGGFASGGGAHHHHHHHPHPPAPGAAAAAPPPGTFGPPLPPHMMNGQSHAAAGSATPNQTPAATGAAAAGATADDDDGWTSDDEDELPDLEDDLGGVAVD